MVVLGYYITHEDSRNASFEHGLEYITLLIELPMPGALFLIQGPRLLLLEFMIPTTCTE